MIKNYKGGGVIIAQPNKEDAQYEIVFGAEAPQEAQNWEQFLPQEEWQRSTNGCVSFSRLNCAETLAKKEGLELNLSDRHLFVLSGTSKTGNTLNAVSEAFRTLGIVREEFYAWKPEMLEDQSAHWQEIFDTSSIPADTRRYLGGNHSWVNSKSAMKSALAFSPLQLAIGVGDTYFFRNEEGIIKNPKEITAYHALTLYWIDEQGNYYVYDSAGDRNAKKILDKDYKIEQCKSFRDLPSEWKLTQEQYQEKNKTILDIISEILRKIGQVLGLIKQQVDLLPIPKPEIPVIDYVPIPENKPKPEPPKYLWDTKENVRHSVRVICDKCGLNVFQKDLICRICECESGYILTAKRINTPKSIDRGLFQINSYWHHSITDEQAYNPEFATRWAIQALKDWKVKTYWSASAKCWNKDGKYAVYLK